MPLQCVALLFLWKLSSRQTSRAALGLQPLTRRVVRRVRRRAGIRGAAAGAGWGQQTAGGGGEVADEGRRVIEADKRIRGQS